MGIMPFAVTLHVYDLGQGQLKAVGTHWAGAFHSGVEVNGKEWSFGGTDQGTGVFSNAPRGCTMHSYKESIAIGETALSAEAIDSLLQQMASEWAGSSYDLLHKNCCHFADALCISLGVGGVPPWVNRAAQTGAGLVDGAETLKKGAAALAEDMQPVVAETGEAVEKALSRLDSKFHVSERILSVEGQALDRYTDRLSSSQLNSPSSFLFVFGAIFGFDWLVDPEVTANGDPRLATTDSLLGTISSESALLDWWQNVCVQSAAGPAPCLRSVLR